ncbi:hypothetical protein OH76DRAFT_1490579 [Lentinus brumalis]|uniref:Uncharacterized protein n=1 Tax=Lentinus brumalis TaxID=2498619 RepID=A0A371CIK4_9APHY|nr:hypothetical protein OH76DRAFT_1490579 [Polyporus brumalis]
MSAPHSPTRSRQRDVLARLARFARAVPGRNITSLGGLQAFTTLARFNPVIGLAVEDLSISLPPHAGYPAQAVRDCLRLVPNLESLVLILPAESPVTLLNGLIFPTLRVFSTNLPHRSLVSFLHIHGSLSSLILRACGRGASCPLRGIELRRLSSLQCPSRCFVGIVHGPLTNATVNLSHLTSMSFLAVQAASSSRLYALCVDFFSNDYDVLIRVAAAAPNLRKLKLNEKPHPQRRLQPTRRPWNNLREWHRALLRLPLLEEFMLRTLLSLASAHRSEVSIVLAWAEGVAHRPVPHPSLYHIALIQRGSNDAQQAISFMSAQPSFYPPSYLPANSSETSDTEKGPLVEHDDDDEKLVEAMVLDGEQAGRAGVAAPAPCIETLRSRVVVLQLEVTLLKAQRATDRAMLDVLKHDFAIIHASTRDLSDRTQRLGGMLERVEVLTTSMKQLSDSSMSREMLVQQSGCRESGHFGWVRMYANSMLHYVLTRTAVLPCMVRLRVCTLAVGHLRELRNRLASGTFEFCGLVLVSGLLWGLGIVLKRTVSPTEHDFPIWAALDM